MVSELIDRRSVYESGTVDHGLDSGIYFIFYFKILTFQVNHIDFHCCLNNITPTHKINI